MQGHIKKAFSNESLYAFLEEKAPADFYDWKTTALFYAGLHFVMAYFKYKKIAIVHSHNKIDLNINPSGTAKHPFPESIYDCYQTLYRNARNARYAPYLSGDFQMLLLRATKDESKKALDTLKEYLLSIGIKFN